MMTAFHWLVGEDPARCAAVGTGRCRSPWFIAKAVLAGACLAAGVHTAHAVCPFEPAHYSVGADAVYCDYNNIQSAIDAAGTCPVVIDIPGGGTFANQHLLISNKNVTLQGYGSGESCYTLTTCIPGPHCPAPSSTSPLVTLDGGNSGGRVVSINGSSNVNIRNLTITHGVTAADAEGGGIDFAGDGNLNITRSTVSFNAAAYGGGIAVTGAVALRLQADALVLSNSALYSGGGVRLDGAARLFVLDDGTLIAFNHALGMGGGGYGGGVEVIGPARAEIASPGYSGTPVIFSNDALYGGGIAIIASSDPEYPDNAYADAVVDLFAVDPDRPVQVSGNSASHTGGAVYLLPSVYYYEYLSFEGNAYLYGSDYRIDDNIAQEGTAIYADSVYDLGLFPHGSYVALYDANVGVALGALHCAPGVACNTINGNAAKDDAANPTAGSTILVQDLGSLHVENLNMRGNKGAHAIRVFDSNSEIRTCLVADNSFVAERVRFDYDAVYEYAASIDGCTFTGNTVGASSVIRSAHPLDLTDSIIDEPGVPTLAYSGDAGDLTVNYVLSDDVSTLPVATGVIQGTPAFVDAMNGDYHLRLTSLGVDFAPADGGSDLDRLPRDVDLSVPDAYGVRDIGAYERQYDCAADTIFCSGFDIL